MQPLGNILHIFRDLQLYEMGRNSLLKNALNFGQIVPEKRESNWDIFYQKNGRGWYTTNR
jgi:hypothetical protein